MTREVKLAERTTAPSQIRTRAACAGTLHRSACSGSRRTNCLGGARTLSYMKRLEKCDADQEGYTTFAFAAI